MKFAKLAFIPAAIASSIPDLPEDLSEKERDDLNKYSKECGIPIEKIFAADGDTESPCAIYKDYYMSLVPGTSTEPTDTDQPDGAAVGEVNKNKPEGDLGAKVSEQNSGGDLGAKVSEQNSEGDLGAKVSEQNSEGDANGQKPAGRPKSQSPATSAPKSSAGSQKKAGKQEQEAPVLALGSPSDATPAQKNSTSWMPYLAGTGVVAAGLGTLGLRKYAPQYLPGFLRPNQAAAVPERTVQVPAPVKPGMSTFAIVAIVFLIVGLAAGGVYLYRTRM